MRAVVSTFLRQRGVSAQDLGLPELVALGHLICGLSAAELRGLDSRELRWVYAHRECGPSPGRGPSPGWGPRGEKRAPPAASVQTAVLGPAHGHPMLPAPHSKAAPFLGSLSLRCTEQQAEVLAARLTSSAAFGPAATWGPEIFAEVGTLAGEGWDGAMPCGCCCLPCCLLCPGTAS